MDFANDKKTFICSVWRISCSCSFLNALETRPLGIPRAWTGWCHFISLDNTANLAYSFVFWSSFGFIFVLWFETPAGEAECSADQMVSNTELTTRNFFDWNGWEQGATDIAIIHLNLGIEIWSERMGNDDRMTYTMDQSTMLRMRFYLPHTMFRTLLQGCLSDGTKMIEEEREERKGGLCGWFCDGSVAPRAHMLKPIWPDGAQGQGKHCVELIWEMGGLLRNY